MLEHVVYLGLVRKRGLEVGIVRLLIGIELGGVKRKLVALLRQVEEADRRSDGHMLLAIVSHLLTFEHLTNARFGDCVELLLIGGANSLSQNLGEPSA